MGSAELDGERVLRIFIGITGATGARLAVKAIELLNSLGHEVTVCFTKNGKAVFNHETGQNTVDATVEDNDNLFSPAASGSNTPDGMIVLPCSMSTLGEIANCTGKGLVARVADVCLKERKPLVLVTRETPLHIQHIDNMKRAAATGAVIMPPCLPYYSLSDSLDELEKMFIGRVFKMLGIENNFYEKWGNN